jgi:hypothetical protein
MGAFMDDVRVRKAGSPDAEMPGTEVTLIKNIVPGGESGSGQ